MEKEVKKPTKKHPKLRLFEIAGWYDVHPKTFRSDLEANADCVAALKESNCNMKGFYPTAQAIIIHHFGNPFGSIEDMNADLRKKLIDVKLKAQLKNELRSELVKEVKSGLKNPIIEEGKKKGKKVNE